MEQVANKKQRDTAAADAEMAANQEAAKKAGTKTEDLSPEGADILGEQEDADVIF
jgi:V-type H+-transporting ATPase subunit D